MSVTINPWLLLAFAVPVLLSGEFLIKRIPVLARFNIPVPVVGGLAVALVILIFSVSGLGAVALETRVTARWWTWLVTTAEEWAATPTVDVNRPFLVAFFTCIGLNASWQIARRGSWQILIFLAVASVLAALQNVVGVGVAALLGASPLLGLICGSVTMTGGHGTAAGFADVITRAGFPNATVFGAAAATFGLVFGGLIGGPIAGRLIRRHRLGPSSGASPDAVEDAGRGEADFLGNIRKMFGFGRIFLWHLLVLLFCLKAGASVSAFIRESGITFPVYIGSMLMGVLIRNILDLAGKLWIRTEVVDTMNAVFLGIFLAVALMSVQLQQLAAAALPMLIILSVQVAVMAVFAYIVTFRAMGGDYDGAVMAGGHCGFGLGATPNAVANMEALVERFGPSPRAFLVIPLTGGFLIDFVNALVITVTLNWIA